MVRKNSREKGYVCQGLSHGFLNSPISAFTIKLHGPIDNVPKASAPCANEVFHDLDHDLRESLLQRSIDSFTPQIPAFGYLKIFVFLVIVHLDCIGFPCK